MVFFTCIVLLSRRGLSLNSYRKVAPEESCSFPTLKLTLTQPLTLTGGQFSSGTIVWLSSNPKANPNLDPNPNPNLGTIFLRGGRGNCTDTSLNKINVFCLLITDYDIIKELKNKEKKISQILCLSR